MPAKILNGKFLAQKILKDLKKKIAKFKIKPGLAVILVGRNPASLIYVKNKEKACKEIGIKFYKYLFPKKTSEQRIIDLIRKLNKNPQIHSILVQLPLPPHLNPDKIISEISPAKDVEGTQPKNFAKILKGKAKIIPATALGIIKLLASVKTNLKNKKAVVIGRSKIVGLPTALLLKQRGIKVKICHSKTKNLKSQTKKAGILVVAIGKPRFINKDFIKEGTIVIDAGANLIKGKLIGDVDFGKVLEKASFITPVPGGVGPMTIAMLLKNVIKLAKIKPS